MPLPTDAHLFAFGLSTAPVSASLQNLVLSHLERATHNAHVAMSDGAPPSSGACSASAPDDAALVTEMGDYFARTAMIWSSLLDGLIKGPHIDQVTLQILQQSRTNTRVADLSASASIDVTLGRLRDMRDLAARYSREIQAVWKHGTRMTRYATRPRTFLSSHDGDPTMTSSGSQPAAEGSERSQRLAKRRRRLYGDGTGPREGVTVRAVPSPLPPFPPLPSPHPPLPSLPLLPPSLSLTLPPIQPQLLARFDVLQQWQGLGENEEDGEEGEEEEAAPQPQPSQPLLPSQPQSQSQPQPQPRPQPQLQPRPQPLSNGAPTTEYPILAPSMVAAEPPLPIPTPPVVTPVAAPSASIISASVTPRVATSESAATPTSAITPASVETPASAETPALAEMQVVADANDQEEDDSDDFGDDNQFAGINMKALKQRGKGKYYCPRGHLCDKGGVDKQGNLVLFDRNSSFAQHCNKHRKPWRCDVPGCPNPPKKRRFARRDGLERHKATVKHFFMTYECKVPSQTLFTIEEMEG